MCDCVPLSPSPHEFRIRARDLNRSRSFSRPRIRFRPLESVLNDEFDPRNNSLWFSGGGNLGQFLGNAGIRCAWRCRASSVDSVGASGDIRPQNRKSFDESSLNPAMASETKQERGTNGDSVPSSFDFLELKRELEREEEAGGGVEGLKEDDLIPPEGSGSAGLNSEEAGGLVRQSGVKPGRQVMRRSNLLAKQVISIQSARSLGYVSQLWVDTSSWLVVLVEVRPNLLSGEIEKFLLEDVQQVGDVVLVQDEIVMENELKMIGLDTLVGYNVVTSGRRNVGKVRGYTFNINSGAVKSLELDSFGFSIIPASLVSTYCLCVEDVLEVVSDTVVVHEDAVSRVQKLTKGIWDTRNVNNSGDDMGDYSDFGRRRAWTVHRQSSRKKFSSQRFPQRTGDVEDDWELPMDY